jgi:hypothetical protein
MASAEVTMVIIETPALTVRLDGPGSIHLAETAQRIWRETHEELRKAAARTEIEKALARPTMVGGSNMGFQFEQAPEDLNNYLPGGATR